MKFAINRLFLIVTPTLMVLMPTSVLAKLTVPKKIILTSGADLLKNTQIKLHQHLSQNQYNRIKIMPMSKPKDSEFTYEQLRVDLPKGYPVAKRVCVHLTHGKQTISLWFAVKAYQSILVASHPIKQHTTLKKSDFILTNRDISGLRGKPYTHLPKDSWLKHALNSNQILTQNQLVRKPQVLQGQVVQIKLISQGITIITKAIAQKDGYIGEAIQMKNIKTNTNFIATVTAPNQAEISS